MSFNTDKLVEGDDFDYVTRTSLNQGILKSTGFVNEENINEKGTWSLGLLQMDFFYRKRRWYAGQFVRKIVPKINIPEKTVPFITAIFNKLKPILLPILVRNIDNTFRNLTIKLPITNNEIDFDFMESFVSELETQRVTELKAYLKVSGLDNYELSSEEQNAIEKYENISTHTMKFKDIFNKIKQGKRLKKDDQIDGDLPFVMSGVTNNGVVGYISNPIIIFPPNSITVDIFGNVFYRNYKYGAGDDTGVYWNDELNYSENSMLYFSSCMSKALLGKFSYGKKLRSSQSYDIEMILPVEGDEINISFMNTLISAIKKLVIKDVVLYADKKISATKTVVNTLNI